MRSCGARTSRKSWSASDRRVSAARGSLRVVRLRVRAGEGDERGRADREPGGPVLRHVARQHARRAHPARSRRVVAARVRMPRARCAARAARAGARSAASRLSGDRRRWDATSGPSTTATPSRTRTASRCSSRRRRSCSPTCSARLGPADWERTHRLQLPDADGAFAALGRGAHRARAAPPPARHPPAGRVATASPSGRDGCGRSSNSATTSRGAMHRHASVISSRSSGTRIAGSRISTAG